VVETKLKETQAEMKELLNSSQQLMKQASITLLPVH
jgi:hypothetical protein